MAAASMAWRPARLVVIADRPAAQPVTVVPSRISAAARAAASA